MSKQETYAWASLASALAILGIYIIMVWDLPEGMESYAAEMVGVFIKVILLAFVVELALGIAKHTRAGSVEKDERDIQIEGKSFRNAYYVVMAALGLMASHLFIGNLFGEEIAANIYLVTPSNIFHALVLLLLVTGLVKALTQVYYYRLGG